MPVFLAAEINLLAAGNNTILAEAFYWMFSGENIRLTEHRERIHGQASFATSAF